MQNETEEELEKNWEILMEKLSSTIGKRPADLNAVLFLIGVQELGQGLRNFTKEQKQDLMHIAICRVLSKSGMYELEGIDQDGWPHWKATQKMPFFNIEGQEKLLKMHVIDYFEDEQIY